MFLREVKRENRNGTQVSYLHLAHSEWDPVAGRSVPKILYGFGREDQLDRDAIKRLVGSLTRLLDPADAQAASAGSELTFCESRPFGRHVRPRRAVAPAGHRHRADAAWTPARTARRAAAGPARSR